MSKELLNIAYHLFDLYLFSLIIKKIRKDITILTFFIPTHCIFLQYLQQDILQLTYTMLILNSTTKIMCVIETLQQHKQR